MQEKEKLVKLMDKNRVTIPKEAFEDFNMSAGDHVLVRWSSIKIEIIPIEIIPKASSSTI